MRPAAGRELGLAFQLTNFIRDVGEHLLRGRIYLPMEDLGRFGVTPADLRAGVATDAIRELIAFEVDRARDHYARAAPGIAMLSPGSQPCIRAAQRLYGASRAAAARLDFVARAAELPAATLVISAAEDYPSLRADAAALASALPDGRLVTVPGLAHPLAERPGEEPAHSYRSPKRSTP